MIRVILVNFIFFIICPLNSLYSEGYNITLNFVGIQDSVCYLANYYGDKTYLVDTAYNNGEDTFLFSGDTLLPDGVYIIAGQSNNKYLEILIDGENRFKIEASLDNMPGSIRFRNSETNNKFYDYIRYSMQTGKNIAQLQSYKDLQKDSTLYYDSKIEELSKQLKEKEDQIIQEDPESLVSLILKAKQEPEQPEFPLLENGHKDSVRIYQYYKDHYWDNLDPADERLLRSPLYHKRLENYFNKVLYQHPDSLIREADHFISRASANKETYKYAIWYLTYKFETSNVMGFDEIFVHMVDNYYATGKAYWADSTVVKSLVNRANQLRVVLIGTLAQNMILIDTAGAFKSLYGVDAGYTIVLFYEYTCSHCKKEIDELKKWYQNNPYDAEIFAVCTDTSLAGWKDFIIKNKLEWINVNGTRSVTPDYHDLYDIRVTPTIYLLDKKKKIIAKRLKSQQLFQFVKNYHKKNSG